MKTLFGLFLISGMVIVSVFSSCRKCQNATGIENSGIMIEFIDSATGRYLYTETNPMYNKDSLKILDESGNSVGVKLIHSIASSTNRYLIMELGFYDPQTDPSPFDREVCKKFTIKYNHAETDTLKVCFKAVQTDCGSLFETIKCFQQGKPIGRVAVNVNRFKMIIEKR